MSKSNQSSQMGPWDHDSCNESFSDLSEAHMHAGLHLKERDSLYKEFWRDTKCLLSARRYTLFQQKALKLLKMPRRVLTLENGHTCKVESTHCLLLFISLSLSPLSTCIPL